MTDMKGMRYIAGIAALLAAALLVFSCRRSKEPVSQAELSVNIYIPDIQATKAETGNVRALDSEKTFSSLQIWVFLSGGSGELVGYKGFAGEQLALTGLPNSAITRFGMPLSREMFATLSREDARVDVYAVANVASVTDDLLGESTSRSELDALVLEGELFGASPLTVAVPSAGLPMSGVLKSAPVTGGYPVLNVSTVTLTRAVSKIRFVFCQQGTPASGSEPAVINNPACVVKSISFGGTSAGHDCRIAGAEKLFTDHRYGTTDNLFDIDGYTTLDATISGEDGSPLMSNADISVSAAPEELLFRSEGHETETAQEYEDRLDKAVGTTSRTAPIYLSETDKTISGTICYNAGDGDVTAGFSMPAEDVFSRNHSWILYAYFAEATRTLQFKIVVLPWDKNTYDIDYTGGSVNVVRRFTIAETDPPSFEKIQTEDGFFDINFWHTLDGNPNIIKGDIILATPVGQKLHVIPVPGALEGHALVPGIFSVTPLQAVIYPNYMDMPSGTIEDCRIEFQIQCNPGTYTDEELEGNYLDLHFCVEIGDDEKWVDLDSESIDYYRIILKKDWNDGD